MRDDRELGDNCGQPKLKPDNASIVFVPQNLLEIKLKSVTQKVFLNF